MSNWTQGKTANILKLDCGDGWTILEFTKNITLCTENKWILY